MSAETSATTALEDTKPLVLILDDSSNQLDEWLASHPPSRLGVPAAFNNGVTPQPIWVLAVPSVNDLAELSSIVTAEVTFVRANELVREATTRVSEIQNDNDIPIRNTSKSPSKKQFRTEIQSAFHDQILTVTSDHLLWSQGKWTIIIRPNQIDSVFSQLANSLASGELRKHSSILALRARTLPSEKSNMEHSPNGSKRPKTSHGRRRSSSSNKSPASSQQANQTTLGIDIFFRPVWSTNTARDVLKIVAGISGRMAQFCKSSLYSRLGIRKGHRLDNYATLYNSKTLATPAEAKLWVEGYVEEDGNVAGSSEADAGPSSKGDAPATSPAASSTVDITTPTKRQLEPAKSHDGDEKAHAEPALKKARNGESDGGDQQASTAVAVEASSAPTNVEESQDEPMLPVRSTSAQLPPRLPSVQEEEREQPSTAAVPEASKVDEAPDTTISTTQSKQEDASSLIEESQTQLEPVAAVDAPIVEKASESSPKVDEKNGNGCSAPSQGQIEEIEQDDAALEKPKAENGGNEVETSGQTEEQQATEVKATSAVRVQTSSNKSVIMATEVKADITSSFTPAFGDDVVKAPTASHDQKVIETTSESSISNKELVTEVAGPMIIQHTSIEAKGKSEEEAEERGEVKANISARFARLATRPPQEGAAAVAADDKVLAQVPASPKADTSEHTKQEESSNGAVLPDEAVRVIAKEQNVAADSSAGLNVQADETKAVHVDDTVQSKEQPTHQDAPATAPAADNTAQSKEQPDKDAPVSSGPAPALDE